MIEHVNPNAEMAPFFDHPLITHHKTRNWTSPPGQRHWFSIDEQMTLDDARDALSCLPVGAYAQSFDWMYESPSDPGAYTEFRRYPKTWTATFSNHGWGSYPVPIDFESAASLFWDGLLVDALYFMGYQRNREPKPPQEHMAHSGLSAVLPDNFAERIKKEIVDYIQRRVTGIDGISRSQPSPSD